MVFLSFFAVYSIALLAPQVKEFLSPGMRLQYNSINSHKL